MKKFTNNIENRLTARHRKCFRLCGDLKGKTILDIGCSFGWFEKMAIGAECKEIMGIEPEEKLFYEAQKEISQAIFKEGSALKIPAKDNTFDMVTMFDVLEHLPKNSEAKAFKEIKRVLKKNGLFVMSTPFNFWLSNIMDPAWYFGHRHYSVAQLEKMLKESGFEVKEIEKRGRGVEMINIILLYIFKWIFRREVPFKKFLEKKRNTEYLAKKNGFMTIFIKSIKT